MTRGLTLAFAESATARRIASDFSVLNDDGKFLKGGLICYDAALQENILNVPGEMIKTFTPEYMEVTNAIAKGLFELIPDKVCQCCHCNLMQLQVDEGN